MSKKLLVIDDSETNVLLLKSIFDDVEGIQVSVLLNSRLAIKKISELKPHLILLDIMMPDMDGFTILAIVKNDDKLKNIPVIVVSAKDDQVDVDRAMSLGALDYVKKPFGIDLLYTKVLDAMNLS